MKKIQIILSLLLLVSFYTPLLAGGENTVVVDETTAEEESTPVVKEDVEKKTVTSENIYFELELVRGTQSPITKAIPYTLYITPKIDSEKTQIIWDVPSTLVVRKSHKEFVNLQKDQVYKYNINVDPQREGTYDITANVLAWKYNTNYTNSVSSTVTLSEGLVVQPVDSAYTVSILLMVVLGIILVAIGGYVAYKFSDKLIKRLKIWLTPPF